MYLLSTPNLINQKYVSVHNLNQLIHIVNNTYYKAACIHVNENYYCTKPVKVTDMCKLQILSKGSLNYCKTISVNLKTFIKYIPDINAYAA